MPYSYYQPRPQAEIANAFAAIPREIDAELNKFAAGTGECSPEFSFARMPRGSVVADFPAETFKIVGPSGREDFMQMDVTLIAQACHAAPAAVHLFIKHELEAMIEGIKLAD